MGDLFAMIACRAPPFASHVGVADTVAVAVAGLQCRWLDLAAQRGFACVLVGSHGKYGF